MIALIEIDPFAPPVVLTRKLNEVIAAVNGLTHPQSAFNYDQSLDEASTYTAALLMPFSVPESEPQEQEKPLFHQGDVMLLDTVRRFQANVGRIVDMPGLASLADRLQRWIDTHPGNATLPDPAARRECAQPETIRPDYERTLPQAQWNAAESAATAARQRSAAQPGKGV